MELHWLTTSSTGLESGWSAAPNLDRKCCTFQKLCSSERSRSATGGRGVVNLVRVMQFDCADADSEIILFAKEDEWQVKSYIHNTDSQVLHTQHR